MESSYIDMAEEHVLTDGGRGLAHASVDALFDKYHPHPYMIEKLRHYVCHQLPSILDNMEKTHEERKTRIADLTSEQDHFMQSFLQSNQYFYVPTTEKYFYYDGFRYQIRSEEDILHDVLTSINVHSKRQLMVWKQRTKVYVMKRIRENHLLLKTVPESETIQHVLNLLYPALFASKSEAKYFLTVLGDNLFRKGSDLIHFISPKAKPFLREIVNISQISFGSNAGTTFKHKYHEHAYEHCRMVHINEVVESENVWGNILKQCALELLCVAAHYSNRYQNSDTFLTDFSHDEPLLNTVFYLKDHSKPHLVRDFVDEYVRMERRTSESEGAEPPSAAFSQITWRNMQYLWKHFLRSKSLPTVMFQQTLKDLVIGILSDHYREDTDSFVGITSKHMPLIRRFLAFWEETITVVPDGAYEYEIDELCTLYKKWGGSTYTIGDRQMQDLIAFYFPDVPIENNKFVYNIRCSLWDKQLDIQEAMENLNQHLRSMREFEADETFLQEESDAFAPSSISVHDAYLWYCKYMQDVQSAHSNKPLLVSKSYFALKSYPFLDGDLADYSRM